MDVKRVEKTKKSNDNVHDVSLIKINGRFAEVGGVKAADGRLHMLPVDEEDCIDEEKGFARLPSDWIAVLHYSDGTGPADNGTGPCPSVIERMRRALMFGASAIIILSLNPKILKELDIRQLFSKTCGGCGND
ncbi:hypothetical protein ScPMuIL_005264 [Solemya velum]